MKTLHRFAAFSFFLGFLAACGNSGVIRIRSETNAQKQILIPVDPASSRDLACAIYGLCDGGATGVRMLSREEYENSVTDFLGVEDLSLIQASTAGYATTIVSGFDSVGAGNPITAPQMERLVTAAESISKLDRSAYRGLASCFALRGTGTLWSGACRESILRRIARAFRAIDPAEIAATNAEVDAIFAAVRKLATGNAFGLDPEDEALRGVIQYALSSPKFTFKRIFRTVAADGMLAPLDASEILTRLSFAVGGSIPDDALYDAALTGKLVDRNQVRAQTVRLLENATVRKRFIYSFFAAWIGVNGNRDESRANPNGGTLKSSGYLEFEKTIDDLIRANGTLATLLSPGFAYVDDLLASKYGVGAGGSGWRKVATSERGGLLQQVAFLGLNPADSAGTKSNGLARGISVLNRFNCDGVAPLTAALRQANDAINADIAKSGTSNPNNLIDHWSEISARSPSCMSCHSKINPAGFPLESFAPDGSYRDQYPNGGGAIRYSGTFLGAKIQTARELSETIARSGDFVGCANSRIFTYMTGKNVSNKDPLKGVSPSRAAERGIRDMIADAASSDAFLTKSGVSK